MSDKLESITKLVALLEGLSAAKDVLNNPKKLAELAEQAASAIALTDAEKEKRAAHELFMQEAEQLKERLAHHDAEKTAFAHQMQEQKDAFERVKTQHSAELHAKRAEIEVLRETIATDDKQMRNKHLVLREDLKKKEAKLHEHAQTLDIRERELQEREEKLKRE